jgi:hypothetical protein
MTSMGMNNWLLLDDGDEPPGIAVAFRWGEVCEQYYRLGETVFWPGGARPRPAAGEHLVPGLANGAAPDAQPRGFVPVYFLIRIIDDLIVSAEPADEQGFALAEKELVARGIPQ